MKLQKCFHLACILAFLACLSPVRAGADSYPPMPEALAALESDNAVTVTTPYVRSWLDVYYAFEPKDSTPTTGFIFYPGALVDPRAYAPPLHALAGQGYLTVIVSMPADLAVFGYKRATAVMRKFPSVSKWAIGGHSLGGVMACRYAGKCTDRVDGVVLWAAYPSDTFSLADTDLPVLSISGSNDGLSTPDEIEDSRNDLPADAEFFIIDGGNHTQFGWYGSGTELQEGDNPAAITREEQQEQIIDATAAFLGTLQ